MFRIDRNLVKISPMKVTTVTEVIESATEDGRETPVKALIEALSEAKSRDQAESPEQTESPTEQPEIPLEPPQPAGPTPEELAEERAEEIIKQADEKAAELIGDAQRRAEELIRKAEEEAEQLREDARRSGFETGAEEARNEAMAELEAKKREDDELLRNVVDVIGAERTKMFSDIEGEVVKLTLAAAQKIVKLASENDDKVFESIIVNALKQMNLEGKITIRVGVREYDRFFSSGGAVFALEDGTTVTAAVIKDPTLADGDLIIDSESGTINAGIDSQFRYIELAFSGADDV